MKFTVKIIMLALTLLGCLAFAGCNKENTAENITQNGENMSFTKTQDGYYQISAEEAHKIMVEEVEYVILDVRSESEYNEAHIPDAVLLPDTEIVEKASTVLPDKGKKILVYCRSGRRSKNAAAELAAMGYSNVWEFGGINDWPYTVVTPDESF